MNSCAQQGGILLYAILSILLLSSTALMLQSYLLPSLMTGTEVLNAAQADYLVESYKSILRQRIGKNADAATLRSSLIALNDKAVSIPGPDGTTLGTVTAKFTVAWFQTGEKQVTVLPTDALSWKPENGTYQMLAITPKGEVTRFDYKFDNNGKDNTVQLPAYASIYFRCARTTQKEDCTFTAPSNESPSTLILPSTLSTPFAQFSKILPASNMLIGFIRENSSIVASQNRNKHDYNILCGKAGDNGFYDVMTVFEKRNGDRKNYEIFLGQHVEAKLTVTPAGSASFSRTWNFNGRTQFSASRKAVIEADGADIQNHLSPYFSTEKNNSSHFANTGIMTTDSLYGNALKIASSDKQPIHKNFLYNMPNSPNDTLINYARLSFNDSILTTGASLDTTMKMAYRPLYPMSPSNYIKSYFAGFIPRMKLEKKGNDNSGNPHARGEGIAVGLLSGTIPLKLSNTSSNRKSVRVYEAINRYYPIDLSLLGFTPSGSDDKFLYSFSTESLPKPLQSDIFSMPDVTWFQWLINIIKQFMGLDIYTVVSIKPCVVVWYFNDGDKNQTPGKMKLLALGTLSQTPDFTLPTTTEYMGLHVNIQESANGYNDLRVMVTKPDLATSRWLSQDADMSDQFKRFLWNTGTSEDIDSRCKISSWEIFDSTTTQIVTNPKYNNDDNISQTQRLALLNPYNLDSLQRTDEPQYILRTTCATGDGFTEGGIYAATSPSYPQDACGLLRDFGLAIQQNGTSGTTSDITYPTVSF